LFIIFQICICMIIIINLCMIIWFMWLYWMIIH
jgi:hypothetical protein